MLEDARKKYKVSKVFFKPKKVFDDRRWADFKNDWKGSPNGIF